jgi:hypothetical protein
VTLGNNTLTDEFYVVYLVDTHMLLSVQWLYSLGYIHMKYQEKRINFRDKECQRVVLRGMSTRVPKIMSKTCRGDFKNPP